LGETYRRIGVSAFARACEVELAGRLDEACDDPDECPVSVLQACDLLACPLLRASASVLVRRALAGAGDRSSPAGAYVLAHPGWMFS